MKKFIFLLIALLAILVSIPGNTSESLNELLDLNGLRSQGDDWTVIKHGIFSNGGQIKLIQDKWLMYFLHWKPLTEERKKISVEYVRKLLLSLWGPNMPFTILGDGGETRVGTHQAFYIDGTIYDGKIRTRFIVWNCPETNRQFIADCNINKMRGTLNHLLKLQYKITSTISCHGKSTKNSHPDLTQKYSSEPFNLSFFIPPTWRTNEFRYPKWYPEGLSPTKGSLWTLPTESVKYVELHWHNSAEKISIPLFQKFIKQMEGENYVFEKVNYKMSRIAINQIKTNNAVLEADLLFDINNKFKDQSGKIWEDKDSYTGKAYFWKHQSTIYLLLAALISRQNMWGLEVDLSPPETVLQNYLKKEVLPNIKTLKMTVK